MYNLYDVMAMYKVQYILLYIVEYRAFTKLRRVGYYYQRNKIYQYFVISKMMFVVLILMNSLAL